MKKAVMSMTEPSFLDNRLLAPTFKESFFQRERRKCLVAQLRLLYAWLCIRRIFCFMALHHSWKIQEFQFALITGTY